MKETKKILNARYQLLREIGQGGFSRVFYAYDRKLKKHWAIKKIDKLNDHHLSGQLVKEVHVLKDLSHPMLPNIVDIIEKEDAWYFVMDYILGATLEEYQKTVRKIESETLISWGKALAEVMEYLHKQTPPIIYQDLKPSNIIIKPTGSLALIDFGIAIRLGMNPPMSLGTKEYAAPEQYGKRGRYLVDERTDIYGLGKTLENLLKTHHYKKNKREKEIEIIIEKCTREDPKERYQSCTELRNHLEYALRIEEVKERRLLKQILILIFGIFIALMLSLGVGGYEEAKEEQLTEESYKKINIEDAYTYLLEGNYTLALDTYEKGLKTFEYIEESFYGMLEVYTLQGRRKEGVAYLGKKFILNHQQFLDGNRESERTKTELKLLFIIGTIYFYEYSDYRQSALYFEYALEESESEVQSYMILAKELGKTNPSLEVLNECIQFLKAEELQDQSNMDLQVDELERYLSQILILDQIYTLYGNELEGTEERSILLEKGYDQLEKIPFQYSGKKRLEEEFVVKLSLAYLEEKKYDMAILFGKKGLEFLSRGSLKREKIYCIMGKAYKEMDEKTMGTEILYQGWMEFEKESKEIAFDYISLLWEQNLTIEKNEYGQIKAVMQELQRLEGIEDDMRYLRFKEKLILLEEGYDEKK